MLIKQFLHELHTYYAVEQACTEDNQPMDGLPPREYLYTVELWTPTAHSAAESSYPQILLRNIRPQEGFCNGTRLAITELRQHVIQARITTGNYKNPLRLIPRIDLSTIDGDLPWIVTRRSILAGRVLP
jgi:hypothetical protein